MAKLRIGPLPDDRPVKRTITFTATLDALIRDYAAERFITTDRAFRAPMHRAPPAVPHQPPPHSKQSPSSREREGDQPATAGSE
jgi:hypothetical protein